MKMTVSPYTHQDVTQQIKNGSDGTFCSVHFSQLKKTRLKVAGWGALGNMTYTSL